MSNLQPGCDCGFDLGKKVFGGKKEIMNEIMLCGRPNACCAKIKKTGKGYSIEDDHGGKVWLTPEEISVLKKTDFNRLE